MLKLDRKISKKLILLAFLFIFALFFNFFYSKHIYTFQSFLNETKKNSFNFFVSLSGIKSLLAVIESSSFAGIGFGDVVKSAYDIIDYAWKVSMITLVFVQFQLFFVQNMEFFKIGFYSFDVFLLISLFSVFFPNFISFLRPFMNLLLKISFFLFALLPIFLILNSVFTKFLQEKYLEKTTVELNREFQEITKLKENLDQIENKSGIQSLIKGAEYAQTYTNMVFKVAFNIKSLLPYVSDYLIISIAIALTSILFFPILFFYMAYSFYSEVFIKKRLFD